MARRGITLVQALIVFAILVVLYGLLSPWLADALATLAVGWARYLGRVVPQLNPDPWSAGTAALCLVCVTAGAHSFLRWSVSREWPLARTLKCVGLVLAVFVAGIALTGATHQTAWLARSPEPLTQDRRGTYRTHSQNNLKQIGVGVHYHASESNLPDLILRSSFTADGRPLHSWQTALLPYIEQENVYKQIDHTKPWNHPANAEPMGAVVKTYHNPALPNDVVNGFAVSHYAGNVAVVLGEPKTLKDFPAGMSNTILAGEVTHGIRAWGDPLNARDPRLGARAFGGPTGRPAQLAMLDGSVRVFDAETIAEQVGKVPD